MSNQKPAQMTNGRQEIQIADSIPGAEYANLAQITHNKEEFQLFYINIAGVSGKVVSKIITTPGHFKRLIIAMQENLDNYEKKFGIVKEAEDIEKEIGFKA